MDLAELISAYDATHAGTLLRLLEGRPDELVIGLSGELDMKASNDLAPILEAAIWHCPAQGKYVLELSRVSYIASMGVGLLTNLLMRTHEKGIGFSLRGMSPKVRAIMEVLGLLSFFDVEPTTDSETDR